MWLLSGMYAERIMETRQIKANTRFGPTFLDPNARAQRSLNRENLDGLIL